MAGAAEDATEGWSIFLVGGVLPIAELLQALEYGIHLTVFR